MIINKKNRFLLLILFPLFLAILGGLFLYKPASYPIEEANNIFNSSIYMEYRSKVNQFVSNHPFYQQSKLSGPTDYNNKFKDLLYEIEKKQTSAEEQRTSHETFVKILRELPAQNNQKFKAEEQYSRRLFEDLVNWLFLEVNLNQEMQAFLFKNIDFDVDSDFYTYLQESQKKLHDLSRFNGLQHESKFEDQFFQGNLPSAIALVNNQTKLIRIGQPICQTSRAMWWWSSPQVSPEFIYFLQRQPRHLYVNLMKRKGVEGPLTQSLESLEGTNDNLYFITLDKNSSFYWQDGKEYPELLESQKFKQIFLDKMVSAKSNYYWSKHLDKSEWKKELGKIVNRVHQVFFNDKEMLDHKERQDFIEITYLGILDALVSKCAPTSMNITCRQCMDRGPSLMVLWLYQKNLLNKEGAATQLLAPPLLIQNRASHGSRIERFVSAAKRFE